ncbi:hypothetical protein [Sphingomonas sanxanigenens]|uniref:Uncharacterized protein n=1 Tax=Sphingomonas sanxanigenens DSM 19645 = NX02 TaxID=1123269 RepID=W0AK70_9SPHN|nr:hypothetical protein [Sphingomonas sanxanigenens]AHE56055.1 hypothetical protein NX02_22150 [Sphingomonas sanxanigenens DSM 19645 = NX02]
MTTTDETQLDDAIAMAARADIEIASIGGYCPVQAEGSVDGQPFYFRARGEEWQLHIGPREDWFSGREWWIEVPWTGETYGAGYMPHDQAARLIVAGIAAWRKPRNA